MKTRGASSFSFFGKLLLAVLIAGGGLTFAKLFAKSSGASATSVTQALATRPSESTSPPTRKTPLALLPSHAALLLDADSSFFVGSPFTEEDGPCQKARAPERVGFAITKSSSGELSFWLSAASVAPEFADCALSKVRAHAAKQPQTAAAPLPTEEVEAGVRWIRTRTGLLGLNRSGDLLFSTDVTRKEDMKRSLDREPTTALHDDRLAWLLGQHHAQLRASLVLPEGWIESIDPSAQSSPLRDLRSATLLIMPSGESLARFQCTPKSCSGLLKFFEKLRQSVAQNVRPEWRSQISRAATMELDSEGSLFVTLSKTATDILKEELNESF